MKSKPPHFGVFARIAPSRIHGVGVRAIRPIPKGSYIFYGDDDRLRWISENRIRKLPKQLRRLYSDFCIKKGTKFGCPSNFNQLTPAWYLNHSSHPNVGVDRSYRFFALRGIKIGEELTADYTTYSEA